MRSRKKLFKGFSLVEMLVVIAIIGIMIGVSVVSLNNQKRNALKNDADKIYNFLKNAQAQATKISPVIISQLSNQNNNVTTIVSTTNFNFTNNEVLKTYKFVFLNVNSNIINLLLPNDPNDRNVNFHILDRLAEMNRNTRIHIYGANVGGNYNFPFPNSDPISIVAVIRHMAGNNNRWFAIGFRTNGQVILPANTNQVDIRVFMQGLNRRHVIRMQNNSSNITINSERHS
ncbi:MAG: Tfp pilus assembly protein FimT/FimU [bacterium]